MFGIDASLETVESQYFVHNGSQFFVHKIYEPYLIWVLTYLSMLRFPKSSKKGSVIQS
jgi:hypothetical protein